MKIYSLSKVLILPLVLMAIIILYYAESSGNRDFSIWLILPVVLLTVDLIFHPQIDYWWHSKYPVPLDGVVKSWLMEYSSYYKGLSEEEREKFEKRLSLYIEAREFKSVGSEVRNVPEDIKGIIGSIPVMMTMKKDDFLLGDFDRIYMYKHPFPSPRFKFLHSVEVNNEDGLIIFSLEHLLPGMTRSKEMYNICLHAFVEAYYHTFKVSFPDESKIDWKLIERTGYFDEKHIVSVTGLHYIDLYVVAGVNYFVSPDKMLKKAPDLYKELEQVFKNGQ